MRFALKDYQTKAVAEILRNLADARDDYHRRTRLVAFALSATTGAGKTVMATAVIEALFEGSEEFDVEADPSAVVLWVTDDPSLNEQTRHRMIESGDRLEISRLKIIGNGGFDQEKLEAGKVYFLNVQKLGSATTWVKHSDKRAYTLWETIQHTIEDETLTLYLVLDEAHRGMKSLTSTAEQATRSTIVQRLINGHNGIPPAPIVWGISATVQRFTDAMNAAQAAGRTTYAAVQVDAKAVQESGLLKDTILLDFPDETGAFETTLLRSAVREMRESTGLWAAYASQEKLPEPVLPLMVLQVPNKPKDSELMQLFNVIRAEWPELGADGIAHVFGEHSDLTLGNETARYIAPQDVQEAAHVRVLLAKDAVSTGWDCPRAEVLFSLRPAKDRTHITQLLGRMVRTPLARRIESDERLNAVICVLPLFDQPTATDVAKVLTGEIEDRGDPDSGSGKGSGKKVLTSPLTMFWNAAVPEEIGAFLASLPSEATPRGETKPIKRLLNLAVAIAVDGLMETPNKDANQHLFSVLDGQMAQHMYAVQQSVKDIYTAEIRRIRHGIAEESFIESTRQERADEMTVDDAYRAASRALGTAIATGYVKRLAMDEADGDEPDFHAAKAKVAALMKIEGVLARVEGEAATLAEQWQNQLRIAIRGLSEERRSAFEEIKRQAKDPQPVEIVTPKTRIENTRDGEDNLLPVRRLHLLADEQGTFPVGALNEWELAVVDAELGREETVGWYRNPSKATSEALQVPYHLGDQWKPMQPDFVFFTRKQDGSLAASIVDPHGDHLSDSLAKLKGLADFAEKYQNEFLRVDSISKIGDELRYLDLMDAVVREAVRGAKSATEMYRIGVAVKYE